MPEFEVIEIVTREEKRYYLVEAETLAEARTRTVGTLIDSQLTYENVRVVSVTLMEDK